MRGAIGGCIEELADDVGYLFGCGTHPMEEVIISFHPRAAKRVGMEDNGIMEGGTKVGRMMDYKMRDRRATEEEMKDPSDPLGHYGTGDHVGDSLAVYIAGGHRDARKVVRGRNGRTSHDVFVDMSGDFLRDPPRGSHFRGQSFCQRRVAHSAHDDDPYAKASCSDLSMMDFLYPGRERDRLPSIYAPSESRRFASSRIPEEKEGEENDKWRAEVPFILASDTTVRAVNSHITSLKSTAATTTIATTAAIDPKATSLSLSLTALSPDDVSKEELLEILKKMNTKVKALWQSRVDLSDQVNPREKTKKRLPNAIMANNDVLEKELVAEALERAFTLQQAKNQKDSKEAKGEEQLVKLGDIAALQTARQVAENAGFSDVSNKSDMELPGKRNGMVHYSTTRREVPRVVSIPKYVKNDTDETPQTAQSTNTLHHMVRDSARKEQLMNSLSQPRQETTQETKQKPSAPLISKFVGTGHGSPGKQHKKKMRVKKMIKTKKNSGSSPQLVESVSDEAREEASTPRLTPSPRSKTWSASRWSTAFRIADVIMREGLVEEECVDTRYVGEGDKNNLPLSSSSAQASVRSERRLRVCREIARHSSSERGDDRSSRGASRVTEAPRSSGFAEDCPYDEGVSTGAMGDASDWASDDSGHPLCRDDADEGASTGAMGAASDWASDDSGHPLCRGDVEADTAPSELSDDQRLALERLDLSGGEENITDMLSRVPGLTKDQINLLKEVALSLAP